MSCFIDIVWPLVCTPVILPSSYSIVNLKAATGPFNVSLVRASPSPVFAHAPFRDQGHNLRKYAG